MKKLILVWLHLFLALFRCGSSRSFSMLRQAFIIDALRSSSSLRFQWICKWGWFVLFSSGWFRFFTDFQLLPLGLAFFIWVVSGLFFGVLLGLAEVRDFVKSQNTRGEAGNWEIQQPNNQALQATQLQIHLQVLHHSLKI